MNDKLGSHRPGDYLVNAKFENFPISSPNINPLTAGAAYIRFFIFKYHIFNMLQIKCDINQQDLKLLNINFVKF